MKLLLDTHVLLWALAAPEHMTADVQAEITDPANTVLFSAASIWEIAIKASLNRPDFANDASAIAQEARAAGFGELPVSADHAAAVQALPPHHRDPFDRLLLAQALVEQAWLYTADAQLTRYDGPIRHLNP